MSAIENINILTNFELFCIQCMCSISHESEKKNCMYDKDISTLKVTKDWVI